MTYKLFGHDVSASKTMKDVGKVSAGVAGGIGASWAASKIGDFAKSSMQQFESLGQTTLKLQRYMGGSAEDASRLAHAFTMTGVDSDTASKGLGILSKHLAANDKAAKSLGISFQDSSGKVKPMNELLPQIAEKFKNMPAGAEKSALAMQLFGKNGMAMLPFLNKGSAGIQELMKESDALGTTLTGKDLDAVKEYTKAKRQWSEAIKGVQVSLGKNLYPVLTSLATKLLPLLLPKLQQLATHFGDIGPIIDKNWPQIESTLNNVGKALERSGKWIGFLWEQFNKLPAPVKELIAMLAIAQKTGVLSIAFKGLDIAKNLFAKVGGMAVQAAVVKINGGVTDTIPGGGDGKTSKWTKLKDWATKALPAVGLLATKLAVVLAVAYKLYDSFKDLFEFFSGKRNFGDSLYRAFQKNIGGAQAMVVGFNNAKIALKLLLNYAGPVFTSVKNSVGKVASDFANAISSAFSSVGDAFTSAMSKLGEIKDAMLDFAGNIVSNILNRIGSTFSSLFDRGWDMIRSLGAGFINNADGIWNFAGNIVGNILNYIGTAFTGLFNRGWDMIKSLGAGLINNADGIWNFAASLIGNILGHVGTVFTGLFNRGWDLIKAIGAGFINNAEGIWNFARGIIGWVLGNIGVNFDGLFNRGWDLIRAIGAGFMNNAGGIWNFSRALIGNIIGNIGNVATGLYNVGRNLIAGLYNGIVNMGRVVWNAAARIADNIKQAIKNAFGIRSPSKVTTWYGQMIGQGLADGIASSEGAVTSAWNSLGGLTAQVGVAGSTGVGPRPVPQRGGDVHIHVTGSVFGNKEQMARTVVAALQDARNRGLQLDLAR